MRRAAVIFKCINSPGEVCQDDLVSCVYEIIAAVDKDLSYNLHQSLKKYKPFTFGKEDHEEGFTLYFSALDKNITKAFVEGAEKLKGTGLSRVNNETGKLNLYKITDVMYLPDIRFIGNKIRLKTVSPIALSHRGEENKKDYVIYTRDRADWIYMLEKNIRKRTSILNGFNKEDEINDSKKYPIKIKTLNHGKAAPVKYKETRVLSRFINLEITADKLFLETIIYSGIGERTASGFGMVMPY